MRPEDAAQPAGDPTRRRPLPPVRDAAMRLSTTGRRVRRQAQGEDKIRVGTNCKLLPPVALRESTQFADRPCSRTASAARRRLPKGERLCVLGLIGHLPSCSGWPSRTGARTTQSHHVVVQLPLVPTQYLPVQCGGVRGPYPKSSIGWPGRAVEQSHPQWW